MFKKNDHRFVAPLLALVLLISLLAAMPTPSAHAVFGDRITVSGAEFRAGGQRIWINGANTPWNNWNDFGGNYNASWWDSHFQQLHDNGINATRIWLTGDGEVGINIDSTGFVSGATDLHWTHLDSLFSLAQSHQIYIMATFLSFDATKNSHPNFQRWRNMLNSDANIDSYVANYATPFAIRYKNNPWLWSIDLINEPDWIVENQEAGQLPWARIQQLAAKTARAVHANSPILFTVGMAMPKYQSPNFSGDIMSDAALRSFVNDPSVFLDFRVTHFYDWMTANWGNTFYVTPASLGFVTNRPWVIAESPAVGTSGHTTTQDYESAFTNGWQGAMAWTSNGVDSNGSLTQLGPATTAFRNNHAALVFPGGPTSTPTPTSTGPTATRTNTPTRSLTPGITSTSIPGLHIQLASSGTDNSQQSAFNLRLRNTGSGGLSGLSFRVYFALDGSNAASSYVLEKYYDQSSAATISGPTLLSGSTYYFTVSYGSASLASGASWDFNTALHLASWTSTYSGSNDWWHTAGALPAAFTDWPTVSGYLGTGLAWGSEPGGGTPIPTHTPTLTATPSHTATRTNTPSLTPTGSLPDLVVTAITAGWGWRDNCVGGVLFPTMGVMLQNNGTASAGAFTLTVTNGSGGSLSQTVSGLAAGASVSVGFEFNGDPLTAVADSANVVAESKESNNTFTTAPGPGTPSRTPTRTGTRPFFPTCTPTPTGTTVTPTRTQTRTNTPTFSLPDLVITGMAIQLETGNACYTSTSLGTRVSFSNTGSQPAGPFVVQIAFSDVVRQLTVSGLAAGATGSVWFPVNGTATTTTGTIDSAGQVAESNETNNQLAQMLPIPTLPVPCTRTPTATGVTLTPSPTPTRTSTPTATPTGSAACSPATVITVPFTFDGAGTRCWQISSLSFINSWNVANVSVNGVDFTGKWASPATLPAKINGNWTISYTGNFAWSHFEVR